MKTIGFCLALFVLIAAGVGTAGEIGSVKLKDGSVINGDILRLENGSLTIRSDTLGTVQIDESRVDTIHFGQPPGGSGAASIPAASGLDGQIQALQQRMTSDPEIMGLIMSLGANPDFQKVLQNPDLMKAVSEGDIERLINSPDFQRLLSDPTARTIQEKIVP